MGSKFDLAPPVDTENDGRVSFPTSLRLRVDIKILHSLYMEKTGERISQENFILKTMVMPSVEAARKEGLI